MKHMKKLISAVLTLTLLLSMSFTVAASGDADMAAMEAGMAQAGGGPGGPGGGGGGGPMMGGVPETAALYFVDGEEDPSLEYEAGAYADKWSKSGDEILIQNLDLKDGDYTFNGIAAKGENMKLRLKDSSILLSVDKACASGDAGGSATAIGEGGIMYIENSDLTVDGAGRYVTSAYDDSKLVVMDSKITSTGNNANTDEITAPRSNGALLISGTARANFSIGATKTYYYDSECIAEGWAALSTDSATGSGLDLYAVGSKAVAQNGGYGTYADTNCRVWLYGSDLEAAEIGAIISKTGQIVSDLGENASAEAMEYAEGRSAEGMTTLAGGRNAVMMHAPDMMGSGKGAASTAVLDLKNTNLVTTRDLVSTEDYYGKYGDAIGAYIDFVSGADLLVRSTSANITLDSVNAESYSGTLLLTVLNADSMGNFLHEEGDGELVDPISISLSNMEANGNILHYDYQRRMVVDVTDAILNGAIISYGLEDWKDLWKAYGDEASNWLPDTEWNTFYGAEVSLNSGAVWNPSEVSVLKSLTVNDGATLNGFIYVDGKQVSLESGKTYSGKVLVSAQELDKSALAGYGDSSQGNTTTLLVLLVLALALAVVTVIVKKKE